MGENTVVYKINVDDIMPNRFNPRLVFDQQALLELAKSIEQHGIIQPLVLRKEGDKYEIIAGERRLKAAKIVGLKQVPAVLMELTDKDSAEVAILENTQRTNLTPIEEARAYKKLIDSGYLIQDQLASRMGKSQSAVSNKLRLLNLSDAVQEALLNNAISERHARSLLQVIDQAEQERILNEIVSKRMNVRDTEKYIKDNTKKAETEEMVLEENNLEKTQILEPISSESAVTELKPVLETEQVQGIIGQQEPQLQSGVVELKPIVETEQIQKPVEQIEFGPRVSEQQEPLLQPEISQPITLEQNEEPRKSMFVDNIGESSIPELSSIGRAEAPNLTGLSPANTYVVNEEPKPTNQFLFDVAGDDFVEDNDNIPVTPTPIAANSSTTVTTSVERIKQLVEELKVQNIDIKLEEFNFDTLYQLNIKIQKK